MGTQSRNTMTLYASQAEPVWQAIQRDGTAFSKAEYIRKKYGAETAPVFLTAYQWFVQQLPRYAPKPEGAEFPYWAFADQYLMESGQSSYVLTMEVPLEEAVFFDMADWNKIIQMRYIGENEADERAFQRELKERGVKPSDVMLTSFYPDLKQATFDSWQRLFRHHEALKRGEAAPIHSLQAGLWCIKKEWIKLLNGEAIQ